jgi:hypothetical protein
MKKLLWFGLALLIVLAGCDFFSRDFSRPEDGKGMLVLALDGGEIATKTIAPATAKMIIAFYKITGTGPTTTFDAGNVPVGSLTGNVYTKTGLEPGVWTITVVALNSDTQAIGRGVTAAFTITPNRVTAVPVNVLPDTGGSYVGTLDLLIKWANNSVPTASVTATLTPIQPAGSAVDIGSASTTSTLGKFIIGTNQASYTFATVPAGYYTLFFSLKTGTDIVMGDSTSVRVVNGQSASGTWDLTLVGGGAAVTINPNLKNPIGITLAAPSNIATATLAANTSTTFDYAWYIDGNSTPKKTTIGATALSDTYDISTAGLTSGTSHNISVLVTAKTSAAIDSVSSSTIVYIAP